MEGKVLIIGGGLAGLGCALRLQSHGIPFLLLEAGPKLGGRVATENADGYLFDEGFQILLGGYPWVQELLDLTRLDLKPVKSGALIWDGETFHRLVDPIRHPSELPAALTTRVISWGDRIRLGQLAAALYPADPLSLLEGGGVESTGAFLDTLGFSERAQRGFLKPFFGGIFLEPELATASNYFRFLFKVFGTAPAGLPAKGMGAIVDQLAERLPPDSVRLNTPVTRIDGLKVHLHWSESLEGAAVVCATDQGSRQALGLPSMAARPWNASVTLYFEAPISPIQENILALNGSGEGVVNSVLVLSDVAPEYSRTGRALISVSLLRISPDEAEGVEPRVREELKAWYGPEVDAWRLLRKKVIRHALPAYHPGTAPLEGPRTGLPGLFACGDYLATPSQQGAVDSGRAAADAAFAYLSSGTAAPSQLRGGEGTLAP